MIIIISSSTTTTTTTMIIILWILPSFASWGPSAGAEVAMFAEVARLVPPDESDSHLL